MRETIAEMGFSYLPFDEGAVAPFVTLRAKQKLKIADSIHLACAASAGIDLFLTGDKQLQSWTFQAFSSLPTSTIRSCKGLPQFGLQHSSSAPFRDRLDDANYAPNESNFFPPSDRSQCTKASEPPRCAIASFSRKRICSASLALAVEFCFAAAFFSFSNGFMPPISRSSESAHQTMPVHEKVSPGISKVINCSVGESEGFVNHTNEAVMAGFSEAWSHRGRSFAAFMGFGGVL